MMPWVQSKITSLEILTVMSVSLTMRDYHEFQMKHKPKNKMHKRSKLRATL